jgi:hypothetical protein
MLINIKCIEGCSPNSTKISSNIIVEHTFSKFYHSIFQKGCRSYQLRNDLFMDDLLENAYPLLFYLFSDVSSNLEENQLYENQMKILYNQATMTAHIDNMADVVNAFMNEWRTNLRIGTVDEGFVMPHLPVVDVNQFFQLNQNCLDRVFVIQVVSITLIKKNLVQF